MSIELVLYVMFACSLSCDAPHPRKFLELPQPDSVSVVLLMRYLPGIISDFIQAMNKLNHRVTNGWSGGQW